MDQPRQEAAIASRSWAHAAVLAALVVALSWAAARGAVLAIPPAGNTPPSASADPKSRSSFEEIAVELRAGQLARVTVLAYERDGAVLVPASASLDLVEVRSTIGADHVLRGRLEPRGVDLGLSVSDSSAWCGQDTVRVAAGLLQWRDGDVFVEAHVLARLLGVDAYVDLGELTVTLDPMDALPLGRRWLRERVRLAATSGAAGREPDRSLALERPAWRGAILDWAVSMPDPQQLRRSSTWLTFGGSLWGGSLDASYREAFDTPSARQFDVSWTGVWPDSKRFRQLRLGRTQSTGPQAHALRGVALSNSPFVRSRSFSESVIRGTLEPGWEVEAYSGGQMIAYQRADERGAYEFEIPVGYGQNAIEIRGYGPHGEVRTLERALRVDFDRLPGGVTEYGISGGQCVDDDCDGMFNLDLRHGLGRNWTLRLGTENFVRTPDADLYHPYGALLGNVARSWQVRLEAGWRSTRAVRLGFEPSVHLRANADFERYDRTVKDPILTPRGEDDRSRLQLFWRPVPRWRAFFFQGDLLRRSGDLGRRWKSSVGVNQSLGRYRLSSDWIEEWIEDGPAHATSTRWSLYGSTVLEARGFAPLHGMYVRAGTELDFSAYDRDQASLRIGRRLGSTSRLEVGAEWLRGDDAPQLTLSLTSTGSYAQASAYVSRSVYGDYSNQLQAEGSLLYNDGTGRIESYSYRSLGRGGIQGALFVDDNGNGLFDPGERTVPGVRLVVGGERVKTDEYGRYAVWNLTPYESANIELEIATLPDPMLVPDYELVAAAVLPNGFRAVDIPLTAGVELSGAVALERGGAMEALGGVPVRLVGVDRTRSYETRTFSDGEFYLMPVAPGRYAVRIDAGYLERMGLQWAGGPEEILVPSAQERDSFDVRIVLDRRPGR
jgi:hypothetical protein